MSSKPNKERGFLIPNWNELSFTRYPMVILSINLQSTNRSVNKVSEEVEFILFDRLY